MTCSICISVILSLQYGLMLLLQKMTGKFYLQWTNHKLSLFPVHGLVMCVAFFITAGVLLLPEACKLSLTVRDSFSAK